MMRAQVQTQRIGRKALHKVVDHHQVPQGFAHFLPNILFEYLYRDASNWKQYGQAVFTNTSGTPLADIEAQIRASLHDGEWFKAETVDLETQYLGDHDTDDDHPWHEFDKVSETDHPPFNPAGFVVGGQRRDIAQFIQAMKNGKLREWDEAKQLCHVCGQSFTEEEWEDRHDLQEPDCPQAQTKGKHTFTEEIHCDCSLVAHARCCPECNRTDPGSDYQEVPSEVYEAHHDQLLKT
jgi:hypothetical protein